MRLHVVAVAVSPVGAPDHALGQRRPKDKPGRGGAVHIRQARVDQRGGQAVFEATRRRLPRSVPRVHRVCLVHEHSGNLQHVGRLPVHKASVYARCAAGRPRRRTSWERRCSRRWRRGKARRVRRRSRRRAPAVKAEELRAVLIPAALGQHETVARRVASALFEAAFNLGQRHLPPPVSVSSPFLVGDAIVCSTVAGVRVYSPRVAGRKHVDAFGRVEGGSDAKHARVAPIRGEELLWAAVDAIGQRDASVGGAKRVHDCEACATVDALDERGRRRDGWRRRKRERRRRWRWTGRWRRWRAGQWWQWRAR
mmetsp:Transcript_28249/g.74622  ORF Transcript_28249/g.74622 Transcript_28249/m.74622 type:complete len:310 (+) Transcript_28249:482-1411(+)